MKANKIILSMAVAAALPFSAMATQTIVETNTPAAVGANGTVKQAATTGPYVTNEPTAADQTHIATTAYVKGAYNDAIAAVNKVDSDKQNRLESFPGNNILPTVMSGVGFNGTASIMLQQGTNPNDADAYNAMLEDISLDLNGISDADALYDTLISAGTVMEWMRRAGDEINVKANTSDVQNKLTTPDGNNISSTIAQTVNTTTPSATTLVSEAAIAGAINGVTTNLSTNYATNSALNSKRVTVYTTWGVDDGTAVTQVPFSTAQ